MSSGASFVTGRPLGGPISTVSEGGIHAGAMSIQSANTTAVMQMYNNTANMWSNIVQFSNEITNLAYKWVEYGHERMVGEKKASMQADQLQEIEQLALAQRESNELNQRFLLLQEERGNRGFKRIPIGESGSTMVGPPEPKATEINTDIPATSNDVKLVERPENYVELPEDEDDEEGEGQ